MEKNDRLVLPTLILAVSSIDQPSLIVNISLIEIALLHGVTLSVAGQMQSITSTVGLLTALAAGAISVRYSYKSLLLAGLGICVASAALCSLAPSFPALAAAYAAMGLVTGLVTPMVFTILGECYPAETRPRMVGILSSSRTTVYLVMVQLIGLVVGTLGWRTAFMVLVVPLAGLGLVASRIVLPNVKSSSAVSKGSALAGYRIVLASRQTLACLAGITLAAGSWLGVVIYSVSYLRDRFTLARQDASLIFSGLVVGVLVGNYVGGLLASRYGRRRVLMLGSLATGLLIACYMNASSVSLTIVAVPFMSVMGGVVLTSANSLALEQSSTYRGTIMSLASAAGQLGGALGASAGGLALSLSGWGMVGLTLASFSLAASAIINLWTREPGQGT
jgi:DHA1 family inner membrane transport protein